MKSMLHWFMSGILVLSSPLAVGCANDEQDEQDDAGASEQALTRTLPAFTEDVATLYARSELIDRRARLEPASDAGTPTPERAELIDAASGLTTTGRADCSTTSARQLSGRTPPAACRIPEE